jgi:hypothetical protein
MQGTNNQEEKGKCTKETKQITKECTRKGSTEHVYVCTYVYEDDGNEHVVTDDSG